jgi:shikimate dehydrogenase
MNKPDCYAVIGHPVAHSLSPYIHARFAAQCGQGLTYSAIDAIPQEFESTARAFFADGGKGLNVTIPHKETAAGLADRLTPRAALAGAVNVLAVQDDGKLLGDNTDGSGLVADLVDNHGIGIGGRRVLVLGAGGATRGIIAPLLGHKPAQLLVANRTPGRASELVARFAASPADPHRVLRAAGYDELPTGAFGLVINATAASLAGELPPLPPGAVDSHSTCYDLAYARGSTPFTRWAMQLGCAGAYMGLGMLVEQAAECFQIWRGMRPDTSPVLSELAQRK